MSAKDWTSEQVRLAETWGICWCGAPRQQHTFDETHPDGKRTVTVKLLCTAAPLKHPQG